MLTRMELRLSGRGLVALAPCVGSVRVGMLVWSRVAAGSCFSLGEGAGDSEGTSVMDGIASALETVGKGAGFANEVVG